MALLTAVLTHRADAWELRQLALGHLGVDVSDRPHLGHAIEDEVEATLQGSFALGAVSGIEARGIVDDAGQHCAFPEGEPLRGLVEERLGGRLDAVGAAAEVDRIEVALEDLALGLLTLELQGDEGLLHLALEGALLGEIEDLDVLLSDRRRALELLALGVAEGRTHDALGVDTPVGPERPVLRGDHGVLDRLRHLVEQDRFAVLLREHAQLSLAVGVVDLRGLGLEVLVRVWDLGLGVAHGEGPDAEQKPHQGEDQTPGQNPLEDPLAATAGLHSTPCRLPAGRTPPSGSGGLGSRPRCCSACGFPGLPTHQVESTGHRSSGPTHLADKRPSHADWTTLRIYRYDRSHGASR